MIIYYLIAAIVGGLSVLSESVARALGSIKTPVLVGTPASRTPEDEGEADLAESADAEPLAEPRGDPESLQDMPPDTALEPAVVAFTPSAVRTITLPRRSPDFVPPPARNARWTLFDLLAAAVLVAFSSTRYFVGTDYRLYLTIFSELDTSNWAQTISTSPQEIGYTLLSLAVKSLTDDPFAIFWVTSALTIIPIYAVIKRSSADVTFALLLYILLAFYVNPFNIVRQGIAVALTFYADRFFETNRTKYVILVALAASMHSSAILAVALQLGFRWKRPTVKFLMATLLLSVTAAIILTRVPLFTTLLDIINPRYSEYLVNNESGIGTYLLVVFKLCLILYLLVLKVPPHLERYMTYLIISLGLVIIGTVSVTVSRMEYFFSIYLLILIPGIMANRANSRVHKTFVIILASVYFAFFISNYSNLVPYTWLFNRE